MKYRIEIIGLTAEPRWAYDFDIMGGESMALEYAKRIAENSIAFRACGISLVLWNMETETAIAEYVIDKPKARNRLDEKLELT